jgi:acetyl/propionyl-CoA carboxylase alpha subunit
VGLLRSDVFRENRIFTRLIDEKYQTLRKQLQEQRGQHDLETLLAAATLIALHRPENGNREPVSPWHQIGHWRILPRISLKTEQEEIQIRYKLEKGKERMWLRMKDRDVHLCLEKRSGQNYWIRINDQVFKVWGYIDRSEILIDLDGHLFKFRRTDILDNRYIRREDKSLSKNEGEVRAPLTGRIVQINVNQGDQVSEGDALLVIESMKMENKILCDFEARVQQIKVSVGQQVQANQILLILASI